MSARALRAAATMVVVALTSCATAATSSPSSPAKAVADSVEIRNDIAYLASDKLEGRLTGTAGNDSAAAYLARRYASLKLRKAYPGYLQKFVARPAASAHIGDTAGKATQNVVAILKGADPTLASQYIVIGAHFDHLGHETQFAMDPAAGDAIRNGADDNASGTAAVLQLARMLSVSRPRRSVIFANFSGEEEGLLGSQYFVENSPVPLDSIVVMLNFDMVGRLNNDKLIVYGTGTATELAALLDSANAGVSSLKLEGGGDGFGSSDQSSFYAKNIPVLHFFTDIHSDYHRATDDVEKINAGGEASVVDLAYRVIKSLDARPSRLTFVKSAPPARMAPRSSGSQAYLGSIPNMSAGTVPGLQLSGVRADSPADKGGLKAGDIVVEFGGKTVTDLQSYSDALYSHKPGDTVKIVFLRGASRMETTVTLGTRGG
ncbi:MAG TPA: M28 family peptidase [Gemmatimonadaceae bacterium]|nr:M28 family peptidase [Gemmatimonadaceae bacterium]